MELARGTSDLSYREACNLNQARGSKSKETHEGRGMFVHSPEASMACIAFLPEVLELIWNSKDTDVSPTEHTVSRIQVFTSYQTPTRFPPQDSTSCNV